MKSKIKGTAVIYARYSSHNQKDISIEQQVDVCGKVAARMELPVINTYSDRAMSGRNDKRPAFQQMLKDATKGQFNVVVAWKSSRIGRNMLEAMQNEARLADCGVRIIYAEEDFEDNAAGRFAMRSMMNVNQFYSEAMAEDIKRGMQSNADKCLVVGQLPFGYKASSDLHYEIDEAAAAVVREIFQRVADGASYAEIAAELNSRNIKTLYGNNWNKGSFHTMLRNERYKGIYIYKEQKVPDGIPRIISDELFLQVQQSLEARRSSTGCTRRMNADYLLSGKVFCGECGEAMIGQSGKAKDGTPHYYYRCKNAMHHKCNKSSEQRAPLENDIARIICDEILTDETINNLAAELYSYNKKRAEDPEIASLRQQLTELEKQSANLVLALSQSPTIQVLHDALRTAEAEREKVGLLLDAKTANITDYTKEQFAEMLFKLKNSKEAQTRNKRRLFEIFLRAVYVYDKDGGGYKIICDIGTGEGDFREIFAQAPESPTSRELCEHLVVFGFIVYAINKSQRTP